MRDLNDYQVRYANQPYERYQVYFRKKKIKEILARHKHDSMLEIGAGLNPIFVEFTAFKQLFIAEPADLFYEAAMGLREGSPRREDIHLLHKKIEDCAEDFAGMKFDFILLSCLLHEIHDQKTFLGAVHRIASAESVIHISVPNANSFHRLLALKMGLIQSTFQMSESNTEFQQFTVFDLERLVGLLEKNGFRITESGSYSFKPFTHAQMENMIGNGSLTEAMLEGFYKMEELLPGMGSEIYVNVVKS